MTNIPTIIGEYNVAVLRDLLKIKATGHAVIAEDRDMRFLLGENFAELPSRSHPQYPQFKRYNLTASQAAFVDTAIERCTHAQEYPDLQQGDNTELIQMLQEAQLQLPSGNFLTMPKTYQADRYNLVGYTQLRSNWAEYYDLSRYARVASLSLLKPLDGSLPQRMQIAYSEMIQSMANQSAELLYGSMTDPAKYDDQDHFSIVGSFQQIEEFLSGISQIDYWYKDDDAEMGVATLTLQQWQACIERIQNEY